MKITKEQIKEAYERPELLKGLFPDVFNTIEVGKWYKDNRCLFLIEDVKQNHLKGYGFVGEIFYSSWTDLTDDLSTWKLANRQEVKEALIKEAKKQHLTIENLHLIKCLDGFNEEVEYDRSNASYYYEYEHNKLWIIDAGFTDCCVFDNGKWAKIIEEPLEITLDQVAEKFNVKSVKIVK